MADRLPTTGRTAWNVLTNVLRCALEGDEAGLRSHISLLNAADVARLRNATAVITDLTDLHRAALRRNR